MSKAILAVLFSALLTTQVMASENLTQCDPPGLTLSIAAAPVTVPINLLAAPYQGLVVGYAKSEGIQSDVGRNLLRIALAPLWIPAVALNIPAAVLSPTGLSTGF